MQECVQSVMAAGLNLMIGPKWFSFTFAEDADCEEDAPDWDALIDTLAEIDLNVEAETDPDTPELEGTAAEKAAKKKAAEVQDKRIAECRQRVADQELGKVTTAALDATAFGPC